MRPSVACSVSQAQKDALILELTTNPATTVKKKNIGNSLDSIHVSEKGTAQQADE